jgi:hypothetical protein
MRTTIKNLLALTALAAVMGLVSGCASTPKQKTVVLDDKGAAHGIPAPEWFTAYTGGSNYSVEALSEFKNDHCFVISYYGPNRDFAVAWVENATGPAEVARMVSETVLADAKSKRTGDNREDGVEESLEAAAHDMTEAAFTGLRKSGDWWEITYNKDTKVQEARAYALYTTDKKQLDTQIAANLANIIENNKELAEAAREIYRDLIADIRANGFNNR